MGSSRFLLLFYSILSLAILALSDVADVYFEYNCTVNGGNYTASSTYQTNLNSSISQFSSPTQFNHGFFNLSVGESPDKVNTIALCRGNLDQQQCNMCLKYTATKLQQYCPTNKEAIAWSQLCMVRYANRDLYGQLENDPHTCAYNPANASNPVQFNQALSGLLNNLSSKAAAEGPLKYAAGNASAGNSQTVYATVQCTPDMDDQNCTTCLSSAMRELQNCCQGRKGCRVLRPTCILRFESDPFYNQIADPPPSPPLAPSPTTTSPPTSGNENKTRRTVIIVIASVVGVLIHLTSPYAFL